MGLLSSDTASLFAPTPKGIALDVMYRQGVITAWNVDTFENTIEVDGVPLTDLPVLGVGEAETFSVGSVVGLHLMKPADGGAETWAIVGRFVTPGSAAVDEVTGLLNRRTVADSVITQEGTSNTSFVDLATAGPSVTVTVRQTGRLLVEIGTQIQCPADNQYGGVMAPEFSGANVISATTAANTQQVRRWQSVSSGTFADQTMVYSGAVWEGLTPGETTITTKYRSIEGAGSGAVDFGRRSLIVTVL